MKQGRSPTELAAEIERQAEAKQDFLVRANAMRMVSNGSNGFIGRFLELSFSNGLAGRLLEGRFCGLLASL